nr:polysaccharide deacetylase family protein [uncultured Anaerosporobacter sp.]
MKRCMVCLILCLVCMWVGGCKKESEKQSIVQDNEQVEGLKEEQSQQNQQSQPDEEKTKDESNDIKTENETISSEAEEDKDVAGVEYEEYRGEIPHIFIHTLIAYPELKDKNGLMRYDSDCINVQEFKNLLEELYKNGYSLIDINETYYEDTDGKMKLVESVQVPKGRKPLIFSVDDVVYDVKKRGNGMVDFLTVNKENQIVSGTYQKDGSVVYSDDNEFVPILEEFIEKHPDFSSKGARMTLCMTGFTGVFGYRTDADYEGDRDAEIVKAKKVTKRLKELGYSFASHSYWHYDVTKHTVTSLKKDLQRFQDEVIPIIGETKIFVYPYGKLVKPEEEKYELLLDYGYRVFCSVSNFFYQRDYEEGHSIYMTRVSIDGYSLRNYKTVLAPVVDVDNVIDR